MSGYPGMISSMDDFYMTSNNLTAMETTLEMFNNTLYVLHTVPQTVSEFLRVMTANYLATTGAEWTHYFAKQNSGTYCNQYMIVDMKLYQPNAPIVANTLWVTEQIPGLVISQDKSDVLREQGYWASYNIPYFSEIYQLSGNTLWEETLGLLYSYNHSDRAEIFRRDAPNVNSLQDMQQIMRYNNYLHDVYSIIPNCTGAINNTCNPARSAMLSIASRGDLMPFYGNNQTLLREHYGNNYLFVQGAAFGAIDSKITSFSMLTSGTLNAVIISGPTHGGPSQLPVFTWDPSLWGPSPPGQLLTYDFPWVSFSSAPIASNPAPRKLAAGAVAGAIIGGVAALILVVVVYIRCTRPRASGEAAYQQVDELAGKSV
jgi:hypothetical protein